MNTTQHSKVFILFLAFLTCTLIIIARLVQLQVFQRHELAERAVRNYLRTVPLAPPRGTLTDCNGQPLAITTADPGGTLHRHYPAGSLTSHVVGYAQTKNILIPNGIMGLEKVLQNQLQGSPGWANNVVTARGKRITQEKEQNPEPGLNRTLTLDLALQKLAAKHFPKKQAGSIIIMDPETGALRVMYSAPTFDPNIFAHSISHAHWQETLNNKALLNRACNAVYPPASLFKLITFAAGLEEGVITPDTSFYCEGHTTLGDRTFYCMRRWGHKTIVGKHALALSCNIPCYYIGEHLGIDTFAHYARCFGLGRKTGVMLSEQTGLVPTIDWKQKTKHEPWWKGETLSASIGQTYLTTTPLQMARMISSIFTGYLVTPRLLLREKIQKEPLAITHATRTFLQESMYDVVQAGTGRKLKRFKDFRIAAKTGTAQRVSLSKRKTRKDEIEHAWFACHFTYKNESPLVMVVLLEHAGSSRVALDVAYKFFREYATIKT